MLMAYNFEEGRKKQDGISVSSAAVVSPTRKVRRWLGGICQSELRSKIDRPGRGVSSNNAPVFFPDLADSSA